MELKMNNKAGKKNWFDVKVVIASMGFLLTLWLWNSFSKELVVSTLTQNPPVNTTEPGAVVAPPVVSNVQPTPFARILMGGTAPQVSQVDNTASQPITQTNSSK